VAVLIRSPPSQYNNTAVSYNEEVPRSKQLVESEKRARIRLVIDLAGALVPEAEIVQRSGLKVQTVRNVKSENRLEIEQLQEQNRAILMESLAERKQRIAAKIAEKDEQAVDNVSVENVKFRDIASLRKTYIGTQEHKTTTLRIDPETALAIARARQTVNPVKPQLPPPSISHEIVKD